MSPIPSSRTANRRFLFFAGKGGAGKTTCSAAAALAIGGAVLALSLDPAHSLNDLLGEAGIDVLELDARQEFGRFMGEHREQLRSIADRGTYFDDEDITGFLDLSLPGLDEIVALLKLGELARKDRPARVVVDLPPTGHALRLFDVSAAFDHLVGALELMQEKHQFAVSSLTGRYAPDAVDAFLEDLRSSCQAARDALLAPDTSAFVLVSRPEPMVLAETVRLAGRLRDLGAPTELLVLNMTGARHMALPVELSCLADVCLPWLAEPPVGPAALAPLAHALRPFVADAAQAVPGATTAADKRASQGPRAGSHTGMRPSSVEGRRGVGALVAEPRRLMIFGGKGGVGKTTLAAATALTLARREPERSVVVLSIDPAHSLGDSFGQPLADEPRAVGGYPNLQAAELDPQAHWREFRAHWEVEAQQVFAGLPGGGRLDPVYDRQIAAQFGNIQPTGLDELQAALSVIDLLDEDGARLVIVDAAPTGHLLRFLESPRLVGDWARELMRMLLKYGLASQARRLSEDLLSLSRKAKRLDALLHDSDVTEVVVVALPEAPVLAETERLLARLAEAGLPVRHVVINQVLGDGSRGQVEDLQQRHPDLDILHIGRQLHPVHGIDALRDLAA